PPHSSPLTQPPSPTRRSSDLEANDMSWMPEPEPTPLRLRLGPRSEVPLPPAFEDADGFDIAGDVEAPIEGPHITVSEPSAAVVQDRKSTRLNSSHQIISYAVF